MNNRSLSLWERERERGLRLHIAPHPNPPPVGEGTKNNRFPFSITMKHLPFFLVLVLLGCSNRPAEMPSTILCKITIVNGGAPQVGYSVGLHAPGGNGQWPFDLKEYL